MSQPPSSSFSFLNTFQSLFQSRNQLFEQLMSKGETAFSIGLIAILIVLILPLPKGLLDVALAFSFSSSFIILMTVLLANKPLNFSVFPSVLLVVTMMRLSLNVASTRLILSNGQDGVHAAGEVIRAFGDFLMGGNFLIGLIVFMILVIINFVVITKGSGRIAEVVARFSLDAMPGKQMAVDADLAAGLISQDEAVKRRKLIQEETNFFGAMDGAAKFVRGDAIAGVLITFINLLGGITVGLMQQGMSFSQAMQTYSLLTVGDGLVTQIPALIISVAAGMLISKTSSEGTTDRAIFKQISSNPGALIMSAGLMSFLALLPGIPAFPFLFLACTALAGSWFIMTKPRKDQMTSGTEGQTTSSTDPENQKFADALHLEAISVELGIGLMSLVQEERQLTKKIQDIRKRMIEKMGFVMPVVRIVDNTSLDPNTYQIKIKEIIAARGTIKPHYLMAINPTGGEFEIEGEKTQEPVFGLPALWIPSFKKFEAEPKGYTLIEDVMVLITHLTETVKEYMPELLSYSEIQRLVDTLDRVHQKLYNDLVPSQLAPAVFQRILQNLLQEQISIRDFPAILEGVSEHISQTSNPTLLAEHVRTRLARQISSTLADESGTLHLIALSSHWEQAFINALKGEGEMKNFMMPPVQLHEFSQALKKAFEKHPDTPAPPVLLTSPSIRHYVRSVVEKTRSYTSVISQSEIHSRTKVKILGEL